MSFKYKTLLDEKQKKKRGMGCKGKGKVAEMPAILAGMSSVTQGQLLMETLFSFIYFEWRSVKVFNGPRIILLIRWL